jgi:uncharacterized repeat protein (TIGR02543 family)
MKSERLTVSNVKTSFLFSLFIALCSLFIACENPIQSAYFNFRNVTYNSNGGSAVASQKLMRGDKITQPADPTKSENTFEGWYEDNETFINRYDFSITPQSDLTLHAKWKLNSADCEHEWGDWVTKTPADCENPEVQERICAINAVHTETRTAGIALGHDMKWVETTAPTYINEGIETYKCQWSGCTHTEGTRPIARIPITSANHLTTVLTSLPANYPPAEPYTIALNINTLGGGINDTGSIGDTLFNTNSDKYVILDLSGSTFTAIDDYAFVYCQNLVGIIIPDSVTSIGESAFDQCGFVSITIPDSVTSIGSGAFYGCYSLVSVTIGNNVTSIGDNAFIGCNSLTNVTIPDSVKSIGDFSFSGCSALTSITIPDNVTAIGMCAFTNCTNLNEVKIPNSVTTIEEETFSGCNSLTSITIPNSVTFIENAAFFGCTSLASVTFEGTIPSSGFDPMAFTGLGDLWNKFYADNPANGTPGTYTTTAPVGGSSVWTKQP